MREYVKAKDVHRHMRRLLWPWFSDAGWNKRPGYTCAFVQNDSVLWVQPHSFGDGSTGSQLTLNLNRSAAYEIAHGSRILRHLSHESRRIGIEIEERIVARFPGVKQADIRRAEPGSWGLNRDIWLRYYAEDDLPVWSEFLTPLLDDLISTACARGSA